MTVLKFPRAPPLVLSAHLSSAGHLLRQHRWLPCSAAARGAVFAGSTCSIARRQLPCRAPVVLCADSFRIAAGRIVRRQLPCRALVVLRVDSFRIAAGLPRADSFRIVRRSTARRQLPYRAPVYRAPTASVSCAGRTARRQLPYCRRSLAVRFLGGAAQCVRAQISIGIWLSQPVPHWRLLQF